MSGGEPDGPRIDDVGGTIHERFLRQAAATPTAVAMIHGPHRTTYQELDQISRAYAAELRRRDVRPRDFVAVALPRGPRLAAVLLGVLRLGAAYSLIDPAWPEDRIKDVLSQLNPRLLAAGADLSGRSVPVWSPGDSRAGWPDDGPPLPAVTVRPGDPCSVFFTSGSTGRPKGAISPHSGTVRMTDGDSFASFGPGTVMPLTAAQPWDAFSLELWAPLTSGGTSVIIDEPYLSGPLIRELVASCGVNVIWATASLFNVLVDDSLECFRGLDLVMTGGERLSPRHVRSFLSAHPDIQLLNGFGPVETTIFCSTHRIEPADCDQPDGIPIGRPAPRTAIYVLEGTRVCADGEVGELCVAGDGLATGYLGNDDLTRQKFPTLSLDGFPQRVYRTGDLGWRDARGILHYRGRADRQVKIRGQRVEPAEVEAAAGTLPGVGRCVVLPRFGPGGDCVGLDACVTSTGQTEADPSAIAASLRTLLPRFSVPDHVIAIRAFPLTPNGKLDEATLRDLISAAGASASRAGQPVFHHPDPLRRAVADAFSSVLGIPATSLDPDLTLVELGANSLDVGRVAARLADSLHRPVPMSQIFRSPTIRGLADVLGDAPADGESPAAEPGGDSVPLSAMQTWMLIEHMLNSDDRTLHCVAAWRIAGRPDRAALRSALSYVHHRHESLSSGYALGRPATATPGTPFPGMRELLVDTEDDARAALEYELARPFRLDEGNVWQPIFIAVRQVHVTLLGIRVHHIAYDGTSASVLARDLAHAYNAYRAGGRPDLPAAPGAAQIAAARRARARYADLPQQRQYWRAAMDGIPPLRYPGGGESAAWAPARAVVAPIPAALVARLRAVARRASVTVFVTYLSAYQQAVAELTGQHDFGIGSPISQRDASMLAQAVSYLVNLVCLRPRIKPEAPPAEAIRQTALEVMAAFAAQDVPFSEVAEGAHGQLAGTRPPLCQQLFALQNQPPATLELTGLPADTLFECYPDIPNEIFTEIWPRPGGDARIVLSYRPQHVSDTFVQRLAARYLDRLQDYAEED